MSSAVTQTGKLPRKTVKLILLAVFTPRLEFLLVAVQEEGTQSLDCLMITDRFACCNVTGLRSCCVDFDKGEFAPFPGASGAVPTGDYNGETGLLARSGRGSGGND